MKARSIVLMLLIGGAIGLLIWQSAGSFSRYAAFQDAKGQARDFHIVGEWTRRGEAHYDPQSDLFRFYMRDSTGYEELVHYHDPKPVNFETAEKVVVIGRYDRERFVANKILMKCPSKYEETSVSAAMSDAR